MALRLRNPHSVLAALEKRPQAVVEVRLHAQTPAGAWGEVVALATRHRIPVLQAAGRSEKSRRQHNKMSAADSERTGAAEAMVKENEGVTLDELFSRASPRRGGKGLWLALDQLQDPHNVGAIFRTAAFFGVAGIVVTRDRSAPMNATVYDVASGGLEVVPFSVQTNLRRALDTAKEHGVWVLGTSEHAETVYTAVPLDRPWLLVVGNEESGMRRLTTEHCDRTCRIPPRTTVGSLNVSVATGILIARFAGGGLGN